MLAVLEVLTKRRPWLIGLILGLAGMTRLTSIFCLPFFLWLLWRGSVTNPTANSSLEAKDSKAGMNRYQKLAVDCALLFAGLAGPLLLLGLYNYLRFDSPLESGYNWLC